MVLSATGSTTPAQRRKRVSEFQSRRRAASKDPPHSPQQREGNSATRGGTSTQPSSADDADKTRQTEVDMKSAKSETTQNRTVPSSSNPIRRRNPGTHQHRLQRLLVDHKRQNGEITSVISGPKDSESPITTQQHATAQDASTETPKTSISGQSPRNNSSIREKAMRRRSGSVPKLRGMIEGQMADRKAKEEQPSSTSDDAAQRAKASEERLQVAASQRHQQQIMKVSDLSVRRKNMFKKQVSGQHPVLPIPNASSPSRKGTVASPSRKVASVSPSRRLSRNLSGGFSPKKKRTLALPSSFDEQSPPRNDLTGNVNEFIVHKPERNQPINAKESRRDRMKRANTFKKKTNVSVPHSGSLSETDDVQRNGSDVGSVSETEDGSYRSNRSIRKYPKVQKETLENGSPRRRDQAYHPSSPLLSYRSRSPVPGSNSSSATQSKASVDDEVMQKQRHLFIPNHDESVPEIGGKSKTVSIPARKESPIRSRPPSPVPANQNSSEVDMKVSRQQRKEVVRRHQQMKVESMETAHSTNVTKEHHHSDSYFVSERPRQGLKSEESKPTPVALENDATQTIELDSNPYEELQREEESWAKKMSVEPHTSQLHTKRSEEKKADFQSQAASQHVPARGSSDEDEWEDFKEWAYSKPTKHKPSSYPKIDAPITMPPMDSSNDESSTAEALEVEKKIFSQDSVPGSGEILDNTGNGQKVKIGSSESASFESEDVAPGVIGARSSGEKLDEQREGPGDLALASPRPDLNTSLVDQEDLEQFDYDGVKCIFDDTSSIANTVSTIGGPSFVAHGNSGSARNQLPRIQVEGLPEDLKAGKDSELPTPVASGKGPKDFNVPPPPPPPAGKKKKKKRKKSKASLPPVADQGRADGAPPPPPSSSKNQNRTKHVEQLHRAESNSDHTRMSVSATVAGESSDHTRKIANIHQAVTKEDELITIAPSDAEMNHSTTSPVPEIDSAISSCSQESTPIDQDTAGTRIMIIEPLQEGDGENQEVVAAISSCSDEREFEIAIEPSVTSNSAIDQIVEAVVAPLEGSKEDCSDKFSTSDERQQSPYASSASADFEAETIFDAYGKRAGLEALDETAMPQLQLQNETVLDIAVDERKLDASERSDVDLEEDSKSSGSASPSVVLSMNSSEPSQQEIADEKYVTSSESQDESPAAENVGDADHQKEVSSDKPLESAVPGAPQERTQHHPADDSCADEHLVETRDALGSTSSYPDSILQGPFSSTNKLRDRSMDYLMTIDSDPGPRSGNVAESESIHSRPIAGSFDFAITSNRLSYNVDDVVLADSNSDVDAIMEAMTSHSDEDDTNADAIIDAMTKRIADITQRLSDMDGGDNSDPGMEDRNNQASISPRLDSSSEDEADDFFSTTRSLDKTSPSPSPTGDQVETISTPKATDVDETKRASSLEFHLSQGHLPPIAEDAASHEEEFGDRSKSFDGDFSEDAPSTQLLGTSPLITTDDSLENGGNLGQGRPSEKETSVEGESHSVKQRIVENIYPDNDTRGGKQSQKSQLDEDASDGEAQALLASEADKIQNLKTVEDSQLTKEENKDCSTLQAENISDLELAGDVQVKMKPSKEDGQERSETEIDPMCAVPMSVSKSLSEPGEILTPKATVPLQSLQAESLPHGELPKMSRSEDSILSENSAGQLPCDEIEEISELPHSQTEDDGLDSHGEDQNVEILEAAKPTFDTDADEINEMLNFPLSPINNEDNQVAHASSEEGGTTPDSEENVGPGEQEAFTEDEVRALVVNDRQTADVCTVEEKTDLKDDAEFSRVSTEVQESEEKRAESLEGHGKRATNDECSESRGESERPKVEELVQSNDDESKQNESVPTEMDMSAEQHDEMPGSKGSSSAEQHALGSSERPVHSSPVERSEILLESLLPTQKSSNSDGERGTTLSIERSELPVPDSRQLDSSAEGNIPPVLLPNSQSEPCSSSEQGDVLKAEISSNSSIVKEVPPEEAEQDLRNNINNGDDVDEPSFTGLAVSNGVEMTSQLDEETTLSSEDVQSKNGKIEIQQSEASVSGPTQQTSENHLDIPAATDETELKIPASIESSNGTHPATTDNYSSVPKTQRDQEKSTPLKDERDSSESNNSEANLIQNEATGTRLESPASNTSSNGSTEGLKNILDFLAKKDNLESPAQNILNLLPDDSQDSDGSMLSAEEKSMIEDVAANAKMASAKDHLTVKVIPQQQPDLDGSLGTKQDASVKNEDEDFEISNLVFASESTGSGSFHFKEPNMDSPLGRLGIHEGLSNDTSDHSYMKYVPEQPSALSSTAPDDDRSEKGVSHKSNSLNSEGPDLMYDVKDSESDLDDDNEVLHSLSSMDMSAPGNLVSGEDHLPASASKIMHDNPKMAEKIDMAISAAAARFDHQPLGRESVLNSPPRQSLNEAPVTEWEKTPKSKTRVDRLFIVPSMHPSPFEKLSMTTPSLLGHVLMFLGDPVAVCKVKSLNRECYHYVDQHMHSLMQTAVRLGGISMNMRPAFWMWVALEQFGDSSPDLRTSTSDEPTQLHHLERLGKCGKWHPVIERDVPRSFGNLPPHKTGARLRTDSIVRALVSWGKSRTMKRGVKGLTEPPPMPIPDSGNSHHDNDDGSDSVSLAPTDTVSEWGGVTPVGSFANASFAGDQEGEVDENFMDENMSKNEDGDATMALSANTLTDATKAILQQKLSFVLHALAAAHPDVGYCQGMDYVVAHLLRLLQETVRWAAASKKLPSVIQLAPDATVTPSMTDDEVAAILNQIDQSLVLEETTFRMMDTFFTSYNLRHFYWPELRCLKTCCLVFERLIQIKLPVLADHFEHHELNVGLFTLGWFQTLFLYLPSMPTATVSHMWDIWLVERSFKIFFRVATAILFLSQPILLNHELEGMMSYLNTFPDATLLSPDILIACALQIKITNKLLMKIEKEVAESSSL